ncbi:HlyD family efflux transporter periplasmic adaptor subunit [Planctomycetes bacterium K23_9]|uniref:efflux RND transporter periplasmic adaptor subunit n=1 Tax=Stieleria marina TaxID=1930275 RepID=UPI00119E5FBE
MQRLAAEISKDFDVAIVAVESSVWSGPMMLVNSDDLAEKISRESIRQLLASAAVVPIACDVDLEIPADSGIDRTRALRVQLSDAPRRSSVLLIYDADAQPSPSDQLHALRLLSEYTVSVRRVIDQLAGDGATQSLTLDSQSIDATSAALRSRHALSQFHADLDLDGTAYRIANESRRLLGCDRTTVLLKRGSRYRVTAISGVAVVDARSNSVKAAEDLAQRASVMSRPMQLPSDDPLPPQIQEPLDTYLDQTGVSTTVILPLHAPDQSDPSDGIDSTMACTLEGNGDIIAMMMLEYFSGEPSKTMGQTTALVASEAMYSLRNSMEHRNVFGLKLWKSVGSVVHSGKMPLVTLAGGAILCLFLLSLFVKVDHHVIATGSAEPTIQRQVFASIDGVVKEIHATDGQVVAQGDPLLTLENADLESRAESLAGELQTAGKRLTSILAMRLSADTDPAQAGRLALEERQLRSEIQNLKSQQDLVKLQQDELIVRSPIDGTVVGWQLNQRLSDRPISRGNLLMRIVDHTGKWSLRLNVPDDNAGPVLEALEHSDALPIHFAIATDPNGSFDARLVSIATAARLDETGQHVIDAVADVRTGHSRTGDVNAGNNSQGKGSTGNKTQSHDTDDSRQAQAPSLAGPTTIALPQGESNREIFDPANVRVGADVTARISCGKRSILRSWFSDAFDFVDRNVLFYFR